MNTPCASPGLKIDLEHRLLSYCLFEKGELLLLLILAM
ncbi:hypothetical protein UF75_2146 [Desulfosporosinus sp. I2]|nr:hypothetical protein UF75_2146 [Desulfosporosinus sp. I2]